MYHDPKHIKDKRHTVRLNDDQDAMVMAASRMFGYHPASIIRELAIKKIEELLGLDAAPPSDASLGQKKA